MQLFKMQKLLLNWLNLKKYNILWFVAKLEILPYDINSKAISKNLFLHKILQHKAFVQGPEAFFKV